MKKINTILAVLSLLLFSSCIGGYYVEESPEDKLVGGYWQWTESVYYEDDGYHYVEIGAEQAVDEVIYQFHYNGALTMRSTSVNHFGHIYEDWVDGEWDLWGDKLSIQTHDGVWEYEIVRLTNWDLILATYYRERDSWGRWRNYRVEEHFVR